MLVKYKVNEVAKDFNFDTKQLLEVLKNKFPERALKNTTALEENELKLKIAPYSELRIDVRGEGYFYQGQRTEMPD